MCRSVGLLFPIVNLTRRTISAETSRETLTEIQVVTESLNPPRGRNNHDIKHASYCNFCSSLNSAQFISLQPDSRAEADKSTFNKIRPCTYVPYQHVLRFKGHESYITSLAIHYICIYVTVERILCSLEDRRCEYTHLYTYNAPKRLFQTPTTRTSCHR